MCHGDPVSRFPPPQNGEAFSSHGLAGFRFGATGASTRLAMIPDIWGCNPFYCGMSTHLADKGAEVFLFNPFHKFGPLPEATREAAFERRHKVRDTAYVDAFESFLRDEGIGGVVGFCLGGLYVFELVRRGWKGDLAAVYPFPQGLANQDALPVPFDYLGDTDIPHTVLLGELDPVVGPDNIVKLQEVAADNGAINLHVYKGSGHGFLADLDADDSRLRENAEDGLARCESAVLG